MSGSAWPDSWNRNSSIGKACYRGSPEALICISCLIRLFRAAVCGAGTGNAGGKARKKAAPFNRSFSVFFNMLATNPG
jgi:hypothetical protein